MTDSWQSGRKIGQRYTLDRLIGKGGVGEVWEAHDFVLQRRLAIKVVTGSLPEASVRERFGREARVLAHLNHPAIVQIYDIGIEENRPYIVMELVEGSDLARIIAQGQVHIGWAVRIAQQVAEALNFAHENNVLHRDIKPSNILVAAHYDRAKLTDFGLAKGFASFATITTTGTIMGTPAYMSPEQFTSRYANTRSDIYSLGATLYHLLTGCLPHGNIDPITLVKEAS
jgi:eukaryotic-like serine/threonine-protein kinase